VIACHPAYGPHAGITLADFKRNEWLAITSLQVTAGAFTGIKPCACGAGACHAECVMPPWRLPVRSLANQLNLVGKPSNSIGCKPRGCASIDKVLPEPDMSWMLKVLSVIYCMLR